MKQSIKSTALFAVLFFSPNLFATDLFIASSNLHKDVCFSPEEIIKLARERALEKLPTDKNYRQVSEWDDWARPGMYDHPSCFREARSSAAFVVQEEELANWYVHATGEYINLADAKSDKVAWHHAEKNAQDMAKFWCNSSQDPELMNMHSKSQQRSFVEENLSYTKFIYTGRYKCINPLSEQIFNITD